MFAQSTKCQVIHADLFAAVAGAKFADENFTLKHDKAGVLSMVCLSPKSPTHPPVQLLYGLLDAIGEQGLNAL